MFDPTTHRLHDLSLSLNESVAGFSSRPARKLAEDGWNASWLEIYSHAGTHMDAPFHFEVNEQTIDQFAPADLMGRAWLVRVDIHQPRQLLEVSDLGDLAAKWQPKDSLLLQTRWSHKLGSSAYRDALPRISEELAAWCVEQQVKILGVEPPSVADVNDLEEVTHIHQILLGGGVIIVEGLTGLEHIKRESVFLQAFPLKISGGDGAPARVIAWEAIEAPPAQ